MQRILVLQQDGSGEGKVAGIERHGRGRFGLTRLAAPGGLPPVVDDPELYLPRRLDAELVLDFLQHPDLSLELAHRCSAAGVPVVASGKKWDLPGVYTPPT